MLTVPGPSCSMWDLVPWPEIEPRSSPLGAQSLSHWTSREVPKLNSLCQCKLSDWESLKSLRVFIFPFPDFFHIPSMVRCILTFLLAHKGFPGGSVVKDLPAMQEMQVWSLGQEIPWRRKWQPTPVFLLWKSHGKRRPASYSPSSLQEESSTT